ncbi:DnaJ domain-containing protein [Bacillus pacificus]
MLLKKQYRTLAKKYHPDTGNGSEEKNEKKSMLLMRNFVNTLQHLKSTLQKIKPAL